MLIEYHFFKSFNRYNIEGFEFVYHLKTHQFCMFDNNKGIIIPTVQRNKILSTETIEDIISEIYSIIQQILSSHLLISSVLMDIEYETINMSNNIEQVDIMITIFYTIIGSFSL